MNRDHRRISGVIRISSSIECARNPESQRRTKAAMNRGFQTRNAEMDLNRMLGELVEQ